jgi:hypothetical protein
MNKKFDDIPHSELICTNGKIHIPSIFMFSGGCDELFPFLYACEKENCTVIFDNEDITVNDGGNFQNILLSVYAFLAQNDNKIGSDYLRYLYNITNMKWDNVKAEV